jgi:hypothetical protein
MSRHPHAHLDRSIIPPTGAATLLQEQSGPRSSPCNQHIIATGREPCTSSRDYGTRIPSHGDAPSRQLAGITVQRLRSWWKGKKRADEGWTPGSPRSHSPLLVGCFVHRAPLEQTETVVNNACREHASRKRRDSEESRRRTTRFSEFYSSRRRGRAEGLSSSPRVPSPVAPVE